METGLVIAALLALAALYVDWRVNIRGGKP